MKALIQVNNLSISFGARVLLKPLSFTLYEGQPLVILGQTGSGKSVLAQAIMGLLPRELSMQGEVSIFGEIHRPEALRALWGKSMVMLPQEPWRALDPLMPAYEQILDVHQCVHKRSHEQAFSLALAALDKVGLKSSALKRPAQLSGGMAQRLAVVTASAGGAKLILADEPTKGLDVSRRDDIVRLLQQSAQGGALLSITHDIDVARQIGGKIIVIKDGEVVEHGASEQVLSQPKHAYTQALIAADPQYWPSMKREVNTRQPLLRVENLSIGRNDHTLAKGINFTLHRGEVLGVCGDSGCGKSTLGDTLLGLLPKLAGEMTRLDNSAKPYQWLKLFQDPPSAFTASVSLGVLLDDLVKLHKLDTSRIAPLMAQLKLSPTLLAQRSTEVSGGELQRFAILRALLLNPVFLFADEPCSRLDPIVAKEVSELLIALAREQNCAVLMVSHDPHIINKCCDSVLSLS